jgi:copper chaperone for superoxide dismutase
LKMVVPTFETTFAVPMTCEACIRDIEGSLKHLSGTSDLNEAFLYSTLIDHRHPKDFCELEGAVGVYRRKCSTFCHCRGDTIYWSRCHPQRKWQVKQYVCPTAILARHHCYAFACSDNRLFLAGSSVHHVNERSTGAAVCILESHAPHVENKVRGLVRMVQVAPDLTIVDLTIRGLSPGTYHATVRETGDISEGPESTGGIWEALKAKKDDTASRGVWGTVQVSKGGVGAVFLDKPIQVWEMVGRSIVVARQQDGKFDKNDPDTLVGVIAR